MKTLAKEAKVENSEIQKIVQEQQKDTMAMTNIISYLKQHGYSEDLYLKYDHFACRESKMQIYPKDFHIDDLIRVDNLTDPDDQSLIYAIHANVDGKRIKGIYVESYGLYHENMSIAMMERIKACRQTNNSRSLFERNGLKNPTRSFICS